MAGSFLGGLAGGLGGGAIGSAVVQLFLDDGKYKGQLAAAEGETKAAATGMGSSFSAFKTVATGAAIAAGAAIAGFAVSSVQAAVEAEDAMTKLQNTLANNPRLADTSAEAIGNLAEQIRALTGVDDDAVIASASILGQFKLTGAQVEQLLPLIVDLSQKMGIDLEAATRAVGKAATGSTGSLQRYGIQIDKSDNASTQFANTLAGLAKVQGFAAEKAKAEPWIVLGSAIQELKEDIGRQLLPVIQDLTPLLLNLAEVVGPALVSVLSDITGILSPLVGSLLDLAAAAHLVEGSQDSATEKASGFLTTLHKVVDFLNPTVGSLDAMTQAQLDAAGATGDATDATNEQIAAQRRAAREASDLAGEATALASAVGHLTDGLFGEKDAQDQATAAAVKHTQALIDQKSAQLELAGGFLGLIESARSFRGAQQDVQKLQDQGKEGTKAYKDAIDALIQSRIDLQNQILDLKGHLNDENTVLEAARQAFLNIGHQAGLTGGELQSFVRDSLRPVSDEIKFLQSAPSTFRWHFIVDDNIDQFMARFDQLIANVTSQIEGALTGGSGGSDSFDRAVHNANRRNANKRVII